MKILIFTLSFFLSLCCDAQYIGVRARYAESRVVLNDNPLLPPSRENRLILAFYHVTASGNYIPVSLTDYPIYVYKEGLQYGSLIGGVADSSGNNYPGYIWTAPKAVSYYNSYYPHYIDCDPNAATPFTVNGHELDCGFIRVSHWEEDYTNSTMVYEYFTAPNVCLPYYFVGQHIYASVPGNVNFEWPVFPTAPYNWYSFACPGSTQQLAIRGVLPHDSVNLVTLPVRFANVRGLVNSDCKAVINWSNKTESDILRYEVERSDDGQNYLPISQILPLSNNGNEQNYAFTDPVLLQQSIVFYRIKAVENTGHSFYSVTMRLAGCADNSQVRLSIYPNPSNEGRFYIDIKNLPPGQYNLALVNTLGQFTQLSTVDHSTGNLYKIIDAHWMPEGTYHVVLRSQERQFSGKVVILR